MAEFHLGCAQMGWPQGTPEEEILKALVKIGYEGTPGYPRGSRSAGETLEAFSRCGLRPAPGYFSVDFWRVEQTDEILKRAQKMAVFMREVGCTELYVATGGWTGYVTPSGKHRGQVAGRVKKEDGLTLTEWKVFADTLCRVGEISLKEGVKSCFHNHVGSVIETGQEMDYLMGITDPSLVFLGPDTGHLAWAGADVVDFFFKYNDRIKTVHVKDVKMSVVKEGVAAGWDYDGYVRHNIFCELGEGDVDFPTVFSILKQAGFSGWVIVETDVITRPTPEESHAVSLEYLKNLGI